MKFSAAVCALLATSAAAFAPSANKASSTALNMEVDRRAAFGQIAIGAAIVAGVPQIAAADGAVSPATIERSKAIYGDRIAALKSAVDKGDFATVAGEKNAFVLFNSGAYPRVVDKSAKKAAIAATNEIFAAIKAKDAGALKKAYGSYVAANSIKPFPAVSSKDGQGYSGDFDYRVKTKSGFLHQPRIFVGCRLRGVSAAQICLARQVYGGKHRLHAATEPNE
eukprot:scaffold1771_cov172-Amphora_coffeaeformis.AAC.18